MGAHAGHTADGGAFLFLDDGVLHVGDYVSPVEIPRVRESIPAYEATLDRLEELIGRASWVVPGHGAPQPGEAARRLLEEDRRYLADLRERGVDAALPAGRDDRNQRAVHEQMNVPRLDGGPMTESDIEGLFTVEGR